ncbi:MAG: hypothetical protein KC547_19245 [Anaerolineae bacterium]|nr:hypothetical protein [Anaerolineae bacterium]
MSTGSQSNKTPDPLNVNQILIAEFQYVAQTAFQANEDRARVSNYFLVTTGASVAAVLSANLETTQPGTVYFGFTILFALLTAVGVITVLQLARLRAAWRESVLAMNTIKDYYIQHFPGDELRTAFRWKTVSIPSASKRRSVAYLLALSVALIDSATAGAAIIYFLLWLATFPDNSPLIIPIGVLVAVCVFLAQTVAYVQWLNDKKT